MCRHERGGKEDSPRSIVAPALQVADATEGDAGQLVREYLHSLLKNVEGDYDGVGCGTDLGVDCDAGHEVLSSHHQPTGLEPICGLARKGFAELDMGLIRCHVEILQAREVTLHRLPCLGVGDIVGPTGFNSSTQ